MSSDVEIFMPEYSFLNKIKKVDCAIDNEKIMSAESKITKMLPQYLQWANNDISNLRSLLEEIAQTPDKSTEILKRMFTISHDMKGQGGSFGYSLITQVAGSLCEYVKVLERMNDTNIKVTKLHINAMDLILREHLTGDGGLKGQEILQQIKKAVAM